MDELGRTDTTKTQRGGESWRGKIIFCEDDDTMIINIRME